MRICLLIVFILLGLLGLSPASRGQGLTMPTYSPPPLPPPPMPMPGTNYGWNGNATDPARLPQRPEAGSRGGLPAFLAGGSPAAATTT